MSDGHQFTHVFSPQDSGVEYFRAISNSFPNDLEELSLTISGCKALDSSSLAYIASRFPKDLRLLSLDLSGCTKIEDQGFEEMSKRCPAGLRHLKLDMSSLEPFKLTMQITERGFIEVVKALPAKLTHLEINVSSCMRIGNEGLTRLAEYLPTTLHHLRLGLSGCSLMLDSGLQSLAQSLPGCLEYLAMDMFGCKRVGDQGLLAVSQALPTSLTQLHLDFRCCDQIKGPGVVGLARALPPALSVLKLDFEKCDIDSKMKEMTISTSRMREWHTALRLQDAALASRDDPEHTSAVAALLEHEECLIRKEAAECMGELGDAALPHLQALLRCLDDNDCIVWSAAAAALVRLGVMSRPEDSRVNEVANGLGDAIQRLADALTQTDEQIRKGAALALYHFGGAIAPHAAALASRLADEDADARKASVEALGALAGAQAEAVVPFAAQLTTCALLDEDRDVRCAAGNSLGALGEHCRPNAISIAEEISSSTESTKIAALEALGRLGKPAEPFAAEISQCLGSEDWETRKAAAEAMGHLGLAAEPHVEALVNLLDSRDIRGQRKVDVASQVRAAANEALCRLPDEVLSRLSPYELSMLAAGRRGSSELRSKAREVMNKNFDKEHVNALLELLQHSEWKVRLQAIACLAPLGQIIVPHVPVLLQRLDDRSINVRLSAAQLLIDLPLRDDALKAKVYAMVAFSGHGDPRLAVQAKEACRLLDAKVRADALAGLLEHANMRVRRGAVDGLASLGDNAVPHVMEVAKRMNDTQLIVQKAAAYTLERLKKAVAVKPPIVAGHLWKQSPSKFRLGQYQHRYVILKDGQLFWWISQEQARQAMTDAGDGSPECKGSLDFRANPCEVATSSNTSSSGEVTGELERFVLKPSGGHWNRGGTFTGSGHGREFQLDAKNSELCAAAWVYLLKCHILHATKDCVTAELANSCKRRSASVPRSRHTELFQSFVNDPETLEDDEPESPQSPRSFRSILFPQNSPRRRREKSLGPVRVDYVDRRLPVEGCRTQQYER